MTIRPFDEIFRDFVIPNVPASGVFHPEKKDIRDSLNAVIAGPFPDNRVIKLNNANEGTPNEIIVSASVTIPAAAYQVLYILNVTQENTGPVTVSGAINRVLVTNINQPVPTGYLSAGMALLCIDTGTELRMLSYGDADAIIVEAENILNDLIERSVGAFASDADAELYLADRSLSAGEGTIYFNTTDKTWKYWDGVGWQPFPYATVADGAITDPKLPDFNPAVSPSSAKIRFMASTSAGAIAGAVHRPLDAKLSESLHAADFGVKADGISDDTAAMVSAFAAMQNTGRPLFLPRGTILVDPDTLVLGDGSVSSPSSKNGQALIGCGATPYFLDGTTIKARNAGNVLLSILGTVSGVSIGSFNLDCDAKCQVGLRTVSMNESSVKNIQIDNFTLYGLVVLTNAYANGIVGWSAGCVFERLFVTSQSVLAYGAGVYLDGVPTPSSGLELSDPHRLQFSQVIVQINKHPDGATSALHLGMTDSNTFIECDFKVTGAGLGAPTLFNGVTDNNGSVYPVNNFFYGCSLQGGMIEVRGTISDNTFVNYCTRDGEQVPAHPNLRGFTDRGQFFGGWFATEALILNGISSVARTVLFETPDGAQAAKIIHNGALGIEVHTFNGTTFVAMFRCAPDGSVWLNIPGVGFKQIVAGGANSGGSGFRQLLVSN